MKTSIYREYFISYRYMTRMAIDTRIPSVLRASLRYHWID